MLKKIEQVLIVDGEVLMYWELENLCHIRQGERFFLKKKRRSQRKRATRKYQMTVQGGFTLAEMQLGSCSSFELGVSPGHWQ